MINCKYDLLNCEHDNGNFIVYRPDSLSNVTAFQVRSTHFEPKPDVKNNLKKRCMHTSLSLVNYKGDFNITSPSDTLNINQSIGGSFKLSRDVLYDESVSAEENVKRVIKMYSDELKQWLFNFANSVMNGYYSYNTYYVKHCIGGCGDDSNNPLDNSGYTYYVHRYTASNAYILHRRPTNAGSVQFFVPTYDYITLHLKTPDTVGLGGMQSYTDQRQPLRLIAAMISPKMQYPDDSRGFDKNLAMLFPLMFCCIGEKMFMHYCDYTSTAYDSSNKIVNKSVELNPPTWEHTMMWTPGCMFWKRGGINISYTSSRLSIAYCKFSEESSTLTNTSTIATDVTANINAVRPDLVIDSNHYASLIPMYHFEIEGDDKNYFVVALFYNERTYSAMYPTSFKGLFILCMETGDMYNASTGFNNKTFALSSDFDVSDLLWMYGWQQYDEASEIGANAFMFTTSTNGVNTMYTFNKKRIEICPYKAFGNYYLVCDREKFDTWFVYDLDKHNIHCVTNVSVEYNHCLSTEGMYGFRFVTNNKTQYVINNNYVYPNNSRYNENVIDCIGIVRPIPLNMMLTNLPEGYDNYFVMHSFTYKPKEMYEPIDINKSVAAFAITTSLPVSSMALYFVVDITTDEGFVEFHYKRQTPKHLQRATIQPIDVEYVFKDNTSAFMIKPYNNIKVYINEFINNDTYVNNSDDVIDVNLKKSSITTTNQSFRIILYDENNNVITQNDLKEKYKLASIDLDFLF